MQRILFFNSIYKSLGVRPLTTWQILKNTTTCCAIQTHLAEIFIYPWGPRAQRGTETRLHPTMPHCKNPAATNQNMGTTSAFLKSAGHWEQRSGIRHPEAFNPLSLTADANSLENVPTKHLHLNKWKRVIFFLFKKSVSSWKQSEVARSMCPCPPGKVVKGQNCGTLTLSMVGDTGIQLL